MKKIVVLTALSIALPFAAAHAQDVPDWSYKEACDPADNWCEQYERRTRFEISGVWSTLPPEVRAECIAETEQIEKSYRILYNCLSNRMQEHITGQARQRS